MRYVLPGMTLVLMASVLITPVLATADTCDSASDQRTLDECAATALKKSDAELNVVYKQIQKRLTQDPDTTKLLVAAQRHWVAFRDAECAFSASGVAGGSAYPMIDAGCRDTLTKARTEQLKLYLACEEGDMSCPVPPAD